MTREELLDDLSYARALAEEGRHAPLLGGSYLVFWGCLNAAAFTAHWALLTGRLADAGGGGFALLWGGYGLIAAAGMIILGLRARGKPGRSSIGGRAERAIWAGAGVALGAVAIGSIARMAAEQDFTAPNAIFGAAFALYGAALFGVSRMAEQAWLRVFGWLSAGVAGALCLFANQDWAYLVAALGSLLVLGAPGAIMLRREPSSLV